MGLARRRLHGMAAGLAFGALFLPAVAWPAEVLLEGFENVARLRHAGKVTVVSGADAVTQGQGALQLSPGSSVEIPIRARAATGAGWLKIDTFEAQPVLACLAVSLSRTGGRRGYVLPGSDLLALPLSLLGASGPAPWPAAPATLWLRNRGTHPVVVDNVRLVDPAAAPKGTLLLDFGPPGQRLWPGFEHAEQDAPAVSWSGDARIYSFSAPFPDPLLGDFAGRYPSFRVSETLTLKATKELSLGWVWVTHYGDQYSPSLEYMLKVNGKGCLRQRMGLARMLSPEGLLAGRGEPWTNEWFEQTLVPRVVSKVECPLKAGDNRLQLANCQLAAVIVGARSAQAQMRQYVQQLEQDLKRYRRQFVLASRQPPRCDVAPTEAESTLGMMIFTPPPGEWFSRGYIPPAGHRGQTLKMVAAAGAPATAAVVVVPCRDGRLLQPSVEILRDPGRGSIPVAGCQVHALEAVPVVENAVVRYQPFLPDRSFRSVRGQGVYWFLLHVSVPERTRTARYQGAIRFTFDGCVAKLPVELEVFNVGPAPGGEEPTWGFVRAPAAYDAYRSLTNAIGSPRAHQLTREILSRLSAGGYNASLLTGPSLGSKTYAPVVISMSEALKNHLRIDGRGKGLIDMTRAIRLMGGLQPGTNRYQQVLGDVVKETIRLAARHGLKDYALYCGSVGRPTDLPAMARLARTVRDARGSPAVLATGDALRAADASARSELFEPVDTLIVTDAQRLPGIASAFKDSSPGKTLCLLAPHPDPYAYGFYCWGIGAHGAYATRVFSSTPPFNAFWFSADALLVPTSSWAFEPTLPLLRAAEGMADYDLARRCEAVAADARRRKQDASALEQVLSDIRAAADRTRLYFDPSRLRSMSMPPARLRQWRERLLREANKLVEPPTSKPS